MDGQAEDLRSFASWFQSHGSIDASVIDITSFLGNGGRGAIALSDIPDGHTLFAIPRSLTLSTRTSSLPAILGPEKWGNYELNKGWVGLILCLMWEDSDAQGPSSKWSGYMASLPTTFDTPMFWSSSELEELKGTALVGKIGREEAERDYYQKLLPAIQSRQDIFSPNLIPLHYSLEKYHIHGSRILSRSFQVERWDADDNTDEELAEVNTSIGSGMDIGNTSGESHMDIDEESPAPPPPLTPGANEDSDDEDEDPSDVAMVPMADMLNARYGSENAKLFYEKTELRMVTTKAIKAGEQIWNTYGDPPNSELLRKYGHVDLLPLPGGGEGNPADIVEIRADLVVSVITEQTAHLSADSTKKRIDWWLEEGGDDVFILETDLELPEPLISLVRLLLSTEGEWKKAQDKGKLPRPKADSHILSVISYVLRARLEEYSTTIEWDAALLSQNLTLHKRHAVIVRLGEKRILHETAGKIQVREQSLRVTTDNENGKKRKGDNDSNGSVDGRSKKTKR